MNNSDNYKWTFIKDLKVEGRTNRVRVTGMITTFKVKEKFTLFTVDDNTNTVTCLYFRNLDEKNVFLVGTLITVFGEYEINRFLAEEEKRIKVHKFSICRDVNEELYSYLGTFTQMKIRENEQAKVEAGVMEEEEAVPKKPTTPAKLSKASKRVPLSKETVRIKLRTLIFRCLKERVEASMMAQGDTFLLTQEKLYLTFLDIFEYKPMIEFIERENILEKDDLRMAVIDMAKLMMINPLLIHSQEDVEGSKYEINREKVLGVKDTLLECIKAAGRPGIKMDDLFKEFNSLYSTHTFILSKEFIWQLAEELHNDNEIFLSNNDVFHYLEKLVLC